MELKVLPFINDENTYKKVVDELPLSGDVKTITTVEPKFIPSNNMVINVEDDLNINIRLVDCVGYIINSAKGYLNEDGTSRLVKTPWFSEAIPFNEAAGLGTKKVIEAHSNIGILLSSDGSFGEFTRTDYEQIETKMVEELKSLNKPFVLVINSATPNDKKTNELVKSLSEKYQISVIAIDVNNMSTNDVDNLLNEAQREYLEEIMAPVDFFLEESAIEFKIVSQSNNGFTYPEFYIEFNKNLDKTKLPANLIAYRRSL